MVATPNGPPVAIQDSIDVEDVMAFLEFAHDRIGLTEQTALVDTLSKLTDRLDAIGLGNVYRTHRHIREVARKLLHSRKEPSTDAVIEAIVETLAERTYAHGHAISLIDAQQMGLTVSRANDDLENAIHNLMSAYADELKLAEPIDPAVAVRTTDVYSEPLSNAIIESTAMRHEFQGELEVRARRAPVAGALNVSVSIPITAQQLQQVFGAQANPATQQAAIQQLHQAVLPAASQAVQDALKTQAPLAGIEVAFRGGRWVRVR
jgi:hypothetical protein